MSATSYKDKGYEKAISKYSSINITYFVNYNK